MIRSTRKVYFDWITLGIYLSLLAIGWFSIFSATNSYQESVNFLDTSIPIVKQSLYLVVSLLIFLLAQFIDGRFWHTFSYVIYGFSLFLLVLVPFLGTEINGARAWFNIGGFSFQPSEFAKFATSLAVCSYLTYFKVNIKSSNYQWILISIIFAPILLILLQPDAGSAITFLSLFLLLFVEGFNPLFYIISFILITVFICSIIFPLSYVYLCVMLLGLIFSWFYLKNFKYKWMLLLSTFIIICSLFFWVDPLYGYFICSLIILISIYFLWRNRKERFALFLPLAILLVILFSYSSVSVFSGLKEHQQERIKVWLKPSECDPRGSLYNILQSKVAIGSGGFFGKGFLNGNMTKLKYVPEQSTDFIFSTIGEEQGFIGCIVVIFLFAFMTLRMIDFAESSDNKFASAFALALAGFIILHVFINIGMTLGLVPIIGIPLPFISKGGSSLIVFSLMVGIFMKLQSRST